MPLHLLSVAIVHRGKALPPTMFGEKHLQVSSVPNRKLKPVSRLRKIQAYHPVSCCVSVLVLLIFNVICATLSLA